MEHQLVKSINKSLDWIIQNLNYFKLEPYDATKQTGITDERKAFGELALALLIISKCPEFKNDSRVIQITNFVHDIATSDDYEFNMQKNLTLFPFYITVYVSLAEVGIRLEKHRKIIENLLRFDYVEHIERTSWNHIDFKYFLEKGGFKHKMHDTEMLYKTSSLFYMPSIPFNRIMDAYATTHILFFLSDFGDWDISGLIGDKLEETKAYVQALTGVYAHKRDWDLLGELLISCHILKHRDFNLHRVCWDHYLESQQDAGDFISRYVLEDFDNNKALEPKERFKRNYHPTLVGLFACTLEYQYLNTQTNDISTSTAIAYS